MSNLSDLPIELFLDNLLFRLAIKDLLHLSATNKFFYELCTDEALWKHLIQIDFNFSGAGTARTSGWKFIYQRLSNPRVYVWGEKSNGRLGLTNDRFPKTTIPDVPFPVQLKIPQASIVSLSAAGMAFHALDSHGGLYVWGTLDGQNYSLRSDGFSEAGKRAPTPVQLQLPAPTKSVSCGRLHASTLDNENNVWTFLNWGRPFRLPTIPGSVPVQVECGWGFSALLTNHGEVFVWFPFSGTMRGLFNKHTETEEGRIQEEDGKVQCDTWEIDVQPILLPSLPPLPDLVQNEEPTKVIQIAGLDCHLIGLTNKGHVLKYGTLEDETSVSQGSWKYLPSFSELEHVRSHSTFTENNNVSPPGSLTITHVFAHFDKFTAFSSDIVLMGTTNTSPDSSPEIIPELQHKSIISVQLGDYHNLALTSSGKLFSWGNYSKGALGLGDPTTLSVGAAGGFGSEEDKERAKSRGRGTPPDVRVPSEVRFDHGHKKRKDRFCIAASAAGWHSGALVIDLEEDEDGDETEEELFNHDDEQEEHLVKRMIGRGRGGIHEPGSIPMIPRLGGGSFRVGYAGRGAGPGRGNLRGQRG